MQNTSPAAARTFRAPDEPSTSAQALQLDRLEPSAKRRLAGAGQLVTDMRAAASAVIGSLHYCTPAHYEQNFRRNLDIAKIVEFCFQSLHLLQEARKLIQQQRYLTEAQLQTKLAHLTVLRHKLLKLFVEDHNLVENRALLKGFIKELPASLAVAFARFCSDAVDIVRLNQLTHDVIANIAKLAGDQKLAEIRSYPWLRKIFDQALRQPGIAAVTGSLTLPVKPDPEAIAALKPYLINPDGSFTLLGKLALAHSRTATASSLAELARDTELAERDSVDLKKIVFNNPNKSADVLAILAWDKSENMRRNVASNPDTPIAALEKLAGDENVDVRAEVACNPHTPIALLEKLAESCYFMQHEGMPRYNTWYLRGIVAGNPRTPIALLEKMAESLYFVQHLRRTTCNDFHVRRRVAGNPSTPIAVLEKLAGDQYEYVRVNVASNPDTPIAALEKLAGDENVDVRGAVAGNPNTPIALFEKLAEDENGCVRGAVASNPHTPIAALEKLAGDEVVEVRDEVASNPHTPIAVLEKLAEDEVEYVRGDVAYNPNTPIAVLEKLAEDEAEDVRSTVARNPDTPIAVLEKLAEDEAEYVRRTVASNPDTPIAVLEKLARESYMEMKICLADNLSVQQIAEYLVQPDEDH